MLFIAVAWWCADVPLDFFWLAKKGTDTDDISSSFFGTTDIINDTASLFLLAHIIDLCA
jgi:hypothetical protein